MAAEKSNKNTITELIKKTDAALSSSQALLSNGDVEGSVNRSYYAMFYIANATILSLHPSRRHDTYKSHNGAITEFNKLLVKEGIVSKDIGKNLSQVFAHRINADYSFAAIDNNTANLSLEKSKEFVNYTKAIIKIIDYSRTKGKSEEQIKNNLISQNKARETKINSKQTDKDLEP